MKYDGLDACRNCVFNHAIRGDELNCWAPDITRGVGPVRCEDARGKSGGCGPEAMRLVLYAEPGAARERSDVVKRAGRVAPSL